MFCVFLDKQSYNNYNYYYYNLKNATILVERISLSLLKHGKFCLSARAITAREVSQFYALALVLLFLGKVITFSPVYLLKTYFYAVDGEFH